MNVWDAYQRRRNNNNSNGGDGSISNTIGIPAGNITPNNPGSLNMWDMSDLAG